MIYDCEKGTQKRSVNSKKYGKLIEMILLVADVEELQADSRGPAEGLIIEARMETGMGPTAVALIQQGVMNKGDFIVAGSAYGKVRVLKNSGAVEVATAGPSTPVSISGLKSLPDFGDIFTVVTSEKEAKKQAAKNAAAEGAKTTDMTSSELLRIISRRTAVEEFNVLAGRCRCPGLAGVQYRHLRLRCRSASCRPRTMMRVPRRGRKKSRLAGAACVISNVAKAVNPCC